MLRFAADENLNGDIVRGLLRRNPTLDIVRIQDVGLSGADDPSVLQWAADQGRILITHDISTLAKHAFDRTAAGQSRHVFAYRLIARDTVEERVLELQQRKRTLADAILTADNRLIRRLRREDLELLLS
jgi:Domain of unknown function (DUF5615)